MIYCTGTYRTRDNRMAVITRLYDSQPICEGYIEKDGVKCWYIWNCDGHTDRIKEQPRDIVELLWTFDEEHPGYD
jgi:hypothetical protein